MTDHFTIQLDKNQLQSISTLGLAHMGDGVYEMLVRGWLCSHGFATSKNLHRLTVSRVCAPAQARAMEKLLPHLTQEESEIARRGRNSHVHQIPRNATRGEYMLATALETLLGYLYLSGQKDRINQLFDLIMEEPDHAT